MQCAGHLAPAGVQRLLLFELLYKVAWFAFVAFPALFAGRADLPPVVAAVFALWLVLLPAAIPWRWLFARPPAYAERKDD